MTTPDRPPALVRVLRLWFALADPVDRRTYVASGLALMAFKYAVDALIVYLTTGLFFSPLTYLSPVYAIRMQAIERAPQGAILAMAIFALPFMWVGVTMSVRRAVDAGYSAWAGVLFIAPVVNFVTIFVLSLSPSKDGATWKPQASSVYRGDTPDAPRLDIDSGVTSALVGVAAAVAIGLAMAGISVVALRTYGLALFVVTPFVMGAVSAYAYNRPYVRPLGKTVVIALSSCVIAGGALLLFAFEGAVCLAMIFPIAGTISVIGALVGRSIASHTKAHAARGAAMLLALPPIAGVETRLPPTPTHEVASSIEIDATPDQVWPNVIGFSELPAPSEIVFRTGIAFPMRARIDGEGVGAVRNCEFSTGPFVEPITAWEPGKRLAFDVRSQPDAMKEWSPYRNLHPLHLDGSIRSRRGEFRLVALPGGRTRLEGSTWYDLSMSPEGYFSWMADALIHAIHMRVLRHVKSLSEAPASPAP